MASVCYSLEYIVKYEWQYQTGIISVASKNGYYSRINYDQTAATHNRPQRFVSILNFHDNFICLMWIVLNNIQSRNKNKWSPFWPLYPYHVAGLSSLHVSLCMLFQPRSWPISMIITRDQRWTNRRPRNQNSKLCWWPLFFEVTSTNCFARHKPIIWYYKRSLPVLKYILPGIDSCSNIF